VKDVVIEGLSTIVSLILGGLAGYAIAYITGLKAVRKGMQLMLRGCLDDMYLAFQKHPPTDEDLRRFEEMYHCYEKLADNGVMEAKHRAVLEMGTK
jgi:hypothetical protein